MIGIGGRELVMILDAEYQSVLHYACTGENVSLDVISALIGIGGRELVMMTEECGETALHGACAVNPNVSLDIIEALVDVGGTELIRMKNWRGYTVLHNAYFCCDYSYNGLHLDPERCNENFNDVFSFIVKQCILADINDEFGIGGLLNYTNNEVQEKIYTKWEEFSPALRNTLQSLQETHQLEPPILHAAVIAKAPLHVIRNIINTLEFSILKLDSSNRLPIEVAIDESLELNEGLRYVIQATAEVQGQHSSVYTAAQYSLKWGDGMETLVEENANEVMFDCDRISNLRIFMVAAIGHCNDLSSIYGTMKMSPEILNESGSVTKKRRLM